MMVTPDILEEDLELQIEWKVEREVAIEKISALLGEGTTKRTIAAKLNMKYATFRKAWQRELQKRINKQTNSPLHILSVDLTFPDVPILSSSIVDENLMVKLPDQAAMAMNIRPGSDEVLWRRLDDTTYIVCRR